MSFLKHFEVWRAPSIVTEPQAIILSEDTTAHMPLLNNWNIIYYFPSW